MPDRFKRALADLYARKYDSARILLESLLREANDPEDRAYLMLHLFTCFVHLGESQKAELLVTSAYNLAPPRSRFPLDAGIEVGAWEIEQGKFEEAVTRYTGLLENFSDLLSLPDEAERLHYLRTHVKRLKQLLAKPQ